MKPETKQVIETATLERYGFLTEEDVRAIAADPETRLSLLLVRCGAGRFMAPAQDVLLFAEIIERDYSAGTTRAQPWGTYVRDISLPADFNAAPGPEVNRSPVRPLKPLVTRGARPRDFNENDCGGAFDGFTVSSDAEGGL